jgi:RNA polymerase sigma-70 factor (ECF subfamily)
MPLPTRDMPRPVDPIRPSDAALAGRLARREAAALDELIAAHQPRVARLAHRLLAWNRPDAQDVVQDVFLRAWQHAPRFRGESSLSTWLARITVNRCRSLRRRRALDPRRLWQVMSPRRAESSPASVHVDDDAARVRDAVARLARHEREVVVLYYLEQMPAAQVADVLGISTGAVNTRLHRARAQLKTMLEAIDVTRQ